MLINHGTMLEYPSLSVVAIDTLLRLSRTRNLQDQRGLIVMEQKDIFSMIIIS